MRIRVVLHATLITAALAGCDPSDPCDPGFREEHGACYPMREPAPDASTGGGDEDGGSEGDASEPEYQYEGFGDECEEQSDCPDYLYCGAPNLPQCTQINCMDDPQVCPPDWNCTDISAVTPNPDVTSVCLAGS